jgi:SAM-dependent methyltransferase
MRNIGPEAARSYQRRVDSGFFEKYLSGKHILDIGYRGEDQTAVPIVEQAIDIDLDYPGYDGVRLPFRDESQDTVFSSHSYEHIADYRVALREWYRVLRIGGFIVVFVPHKYLYERKSTPPSLFNPDHKRFYTAASLLREFEESLPPNGFRIRHLAENDVGFDYSTPIGEHARGCYEIELVIEKIRRPAYSDQFELPDDKRAQLEQKHRAVAEALAAAMSSKKNERALRGLAAQPYFPTYEIVRSRLAAQGDIDETGLKETLRRILPLAAFDEALYLRLYPDVKHAIETGALTSARDHFVAHGYFEGRAFQPDPIDLDLASEKAGRP